MSGHTSANTAILPSKPKVRAPGYYNGLFSTMLRNIYIYGMCAYVPYMLEKTLPNDAENWLLTEGTVSVAQLNSY